MPESATLARALFTPRRIALVASDRPGTMGAVLAANLASFPGDVIHVRAGQSLRDLPTPIDLVVVAVPAAAVPDVAADADAAGVTAMVVLSGGFAETGPAGAELQRRLVAAAGRVRVVGPNCSGVQNCDLPLNASIAPGLPAGGGGISLVTQSGAYAMAVHDLAADEGVRFARICAPGNACDVTPADLLDALAADPATRTVCLLLESPADGRSFVERAARVTADHPVLVLLTGRSTSGARAAASHTAALASRHAVARAAFGDAGIVQVESGQELLDVARAVDCQPLPRGDRVAIVTNSGGMGVELTDLLADRGLDVPLLSTPLQELIGSVLPTHASARNPVDITPAWTLFATAYPRTVELLARSGEVDAVVVVLVQRAATDAATVDGMIGAAGRLHDDEVPVPVYVCWVAPRAADAGARRLQQADVPVLGPPARTARAVAGARDAARVRERPSVRRRPDRGQPAAALRGRRPDADDPVATATWLRRHGVPVVDAALCRTAAEAAAASTTFPAVVKIARSVHRSDEDGVRLGLADRAAVAAAAAELLARSDGVLVSPQLAGLEMIVGGLRDPSFGPVVMVGFGGLWVELLDDVAFAPAPLDPPRALDLLTVLRGRRLLRGARGSPPVDLTALADLVVAVSMLIAADPTITSIDLNPVIATATGAVAVDWKICSPGRDSGRCLSRQAEDHG